jgi:hypothetical protein
MPLANRYPIGGLVWHSTQHRNGGSLSPSDGAAFVEEVKRELASRARYRRIAGDDGASVLRDGAGGYGTTIPGSKWAA